jgi:hypothetical protein
MDQSEENNESLEDTSRLTDSDRKRNKSLCNTPAQKIIFGIYFNCAYAWMKYSNLNSQAGSHNTRRRSVMNCGRPAYPIPVRVVKYRGSSSVSVDGDLDAASSRNSLARAVQHFWLSYLILLTVSGDSKCFCWNRCNSDCNSMYRFRVWVFSRLSSSSL